MNDLTDIHYLTQLFACHGFHLSKGLGQNFIVDPAVCPRIAEMAGIDGQGVLEIGPGAGVLTRALAERAAKVVALEVDRRLAPLLKETVPLRISFSRNARRFREKRSIKSSRKRACSCGISIKTVCVPSCVSPSVRRRRRTLCFGR